MPSALLGSSFYSSVTVQNYTENSPNFATNMIDGDLVTNLGGEGTLASGSNVDYDPNPIFTITNTNPVDASGITIYNDKGLAGDGAEDVIVRMYDADGNLLGTENLTIPTSKYEGDLSFSSGTTYEGIATWEFEVDNNFSGSGATRQTLQIRELGLFGDLSPEPTTTPVCFTKGMKLETEAGAVAVEDLKVGDKLRTVDNDLQEIRYIYRRAFPATGSHRPVIFEPGSIGNDERVIVSQQHRFLTHTLPNETLFGTLDNFLVQACQLVNGTTIRIADNFGTVEYFHIMLDQHELVYCHGTVSESWQPHCRNLKRDQALKEELLSLFPEIADHRGQSPAKGAPVRLEVALA